MNKGIEMEGKKKLDEVEMSRAKRCITVFEAVVLGSEWVQSWRKRF